MGCPERMIFIFLAFIGGFILNGIRFNLNVAMIAMVKHPSLNILETNNVTYGDCAAPENMRNTSNDDITIQQGEFDWSVKLQHLALGSFFFGYVAFQIPLGILAEKYHAKHFYGVGILLNCILTLLTPLAARYSIGALCAVRIIQGIAQAGAWPAMHILISRWTPVNERSIAVSIMHCGNAAGLVVCFIATGLLSETTFLGGWPPFFYLLGTFGCMWFLFWNSLVYETPKQHPYISKEELMCINENQPEVIAKQPIPWKSILTSTPFWAFLIVGIGDDWGVYTILNESPIYFNSILHLDMRMNGLFTGIFNILNAVVGIAAGIFCDILRKRKVFSITTIRKLMTSTGLYLPAAFIFVIPYVGCSSTIIIALISIAMSLKGFSVPGIYATHVDLSPQFAGTIYATYNTFANLAGFLVPIYNGWILDFYTQNPLYAWQIIFITTTAVSIVCGIVFNAFGSAEYQNWGDASVDNGQCNTEIIKRKHENGILDVTQEEYITRC